MCSYTYIYIYNQIRKASFRRVVKEIAAEIKPGVKFQKIAIEALHEACEHYLLELFRNSNLFAIHADRKTVTAKDLQLALRMKGKIMRDTNE